MAIQRLGSSLIAKSQPGSRLRSSEEDRQTGAIQRGSDSAQTGSPVRGSVDEPIEKLNPQGTQKIVSVQPSITPTEKSVVSKVGIAPSIGAASRVNNPSGASNGGGVGKTSNPGGGAAPASRTAFRAAQVGASASGVGRPAIGYAPGGGGAEGAVKGASTARQGSVSRVTNPTVNNNKSKGQPSSGLGSRVALTAGKGILEAGKKLAGPVAEGAELGLRGLSLPIGLGAIVIGSEVKRQAAAKQNIADNKANMKRMQEMKANPAKAFAEMSKKPTQISAPKPTAQKKAAALVKKASAPLRSAVKSTAKKASNTVKKAGATIRSLFKR